MPKLTAPLLALALTIQPALPTTASPAPAHLARTAADLPDETLIRDPATHRIYLVWGGMRYKLNSSATLAALGLDGSTVAKVTADALQAIPAGPTLRLRLAHGLVYPLSPLACGHPHLSLSLPAATPGTTITIAGSGFGPNEGLRIVFAGSTATATATADGKGAFRSSSSIPPGAAVGTILRLYASGAASHALEVEPISVIAASSPPSLVVPSAVTAPGTAVQVGGAGFQPGEPVDLFLAQGSAATAIVADRAGGFANAQLAVPSTMRAARHPLIAFGTTSKLLATSTLTVGNPNAPAGTGTASSPSTGGISLSRYTASPGSLELLGGSGFAPGETVTARFDNATILSITADAKGAFRDASFTLPTTIANGQYPVVATGTTSHRVARTSLTVAGLLPTIALAPTAATPGTPVQVSGQGFEAGEVVTLALNGQAVATIPAVVTASTSGGFAASFAVPPAALDGTNTVAATGASSRGTAIAALTVQLAAQASWYFAGGDTSVGASTGIALVNPNDTPATVHARFMFTAGPPLPYSTVVPPNSRATIDVGGVVGPGRVVFTALTADRPIGAEETVYRPAGDFSSAVGVGAPLTTWYLAEGYTGLSFHEYLRIFNPGLAPARAYLQLLPFNGHAPLAITRLVGPQSGVVLDLNTLLPNRSLSAIVQSDQPVVVDRLQTFGANAYGATEGTGIGTPASTWLFAEGSTLHNFETFLTVLNPDPSRRATVTATCFDATGRVLANKTILIDAHRRGNIPLNDLVHSSGVATILSSSIPVVAERPFYFGAPNGRTALAGGSDVFGRNGGGVRWLFPEGDTRAGALEFFALLNPGQQPAEVRVRFYTTTGVTVDRAITLPPRSRQTLDVRRDMPTLPAGQHSALVTATNGVPIVVEQSIYTDNFAKGDGIAGIAQ